MTGRWRNIFTYKSRLEVTNKARSGKEQTVDRIAYFLEQYTTHTDKSKLEVTGR